MPIRILPPLLVSQIAAGEVVDRPASVVKELVENALDAGATRIDVSIEEGGRDLVRVTDDGAGIAAEELPLAIAAHATSKISAPSDLEAILTMGFRGEALASIASVSRLSILSRTRTNEAASELLVEGERIDGPQPASGPPGTTVTVRTLFFNTPARRKFLKSPAAESARVVDTVENLALGNPSVRFTLRSEGRTLLDLAATDDPRRRSLDVVGRELEPRLLVAEGTAGSLIAWGLVGHPELAKPSTRHLRIHLNGRPIADRAIIHALREAYRGLVPPGSAPLVVLHLEMDPREVDVNVHPAKSEVRFRQPQLVHQVVYRAVRSALRAADLVPAFELESSARSWTDGAALVAKAHSSGSWSDAGRGAPGVSIADGRVRLAEIAARLGPMPDLDAPTLPEPVRAVEILQVHKSFLVTQDAEGLLIVDQHALHERVMFEMLLERVTRGTLESQRMLLPIVLEATAAEIEALPEIAALAGRIGLDLVAAGPRSIAVQGFPSFLFERGVDPTEFTREVLAKAVDGLGRGDNADLEAALADVLDMMACKAAVKAGDALTLEELRALLAARERVERSTNCPHGRPTSLRITIRDLERQFGRG